MSNGAAILATPWNPASFVSVQFDVRADASVEQSMADSAPQHRENKSSWGCRGVGANGPETFGSESGVGNTPRGGRQQ